MKQTMGWTRQLGPEMEMMRRAREVLATSTTCLDYVQERAVGHRVFTMSGQILYDFCSGVGQKNTGHNHPAINAAKRWCIDRMSANLVSHDWLSGLAVLLAERLVATTPGSFPKKVFFARGGAEANEHALKLIKAKSGLRHLGKKMFAFENSFHGRSEGALRNTDSKQVQWHEFVDEGERPFFLPFPEAGHSCEQYLHKLRSKLGCRSDDNIFCKVRGLNPAGIILECVQGEGGINAGCKSCLPYIVRAFENAGALVVADEVQTGFWRTGKMFASEHYGIFPDIISLGKSLCPESALAASVFRADLDLKPGQNSNTGVNPDALAVALAADEVYSCLDMGKLAECIALLTRVAPVGLGLMRRIECEDKEQRDKIVEDAAIMSPGLILLGAGSDRLGQRFIRLMPPVNIEPSDLSVMISMLKNVCAGRGLIL